MPRQYCTFWLGEMLLGIPVEQVQEVLMHQTITPVPLASTAIRGLINLRGQIVPAVDLRDCLTLDDASLKDRTVNVIVHAERETISLLVDRSGDVLDVEESQFEQPPGTLEDAVFELLTGVYKLDSHLLHAVDVEALVKRMEPVSDKL